VTLELVPFAEGTDPAEFATALAPGFDGDEGPAREILAETCALLTRDPRPAPWGSYVVHLDGRPIGIAAFKSAPAPDGGVEIAYMTFPAYEGRGHATATIAALVEIAEAARSPTPSPRKMPPTRPSAATASPMPAKSTIPKRPDLALGIALKTPLPFWGSWQQDHPPDGPKSWRDGGARPAQPGGRVRAADHASAIDLTPGAVADTLPACARVSLSPTLVFDGEPFFGQDRIDVALWRMKQAGLAPR
jgi:hypothetical protein